MANHFSARNRRNSSDEITNPGPQKTMVGGPPITTADGGDLNGSEVKPRWPNRICRINGYDLNAVDYYPVLIIGAGESGLAMGCRLKSQLGFDQFRIFDRQGGIGGTWWINRYPGVACDVPAIFYSFSFAPNPKWSTWYPTGPEIVRYLQDVCAKFGITDKIQLNTSIDGAKWLEDEEVWEVYLRHMVHGTGDLSGNDREEKIKKEGEQSVYLGKETVRAKVLISAVGGLVDPKKWPENIPGTESFEGEIFHSARWRHDIDLKDKNVIVVGTGCSSAQLVPKIIKPPFNAKSVTQIMRTPGWVAPRLPPPGGKKNWEKYAPTLLNYVPFLEKSIRFMAFMGSEELFSIFGDKPRNVKSRKAFQQALIDHLHKTAPGKYHEMLTPDYAAGCKRLVFDTWWLPSLNDPKVELTTQPLTQIKPKSVVLGPGTLQSKDAEAGSQQEREIPADVIVQANGFETTRWLHPLDIKGSGGVDLIDAMMDRGGSQAYQGTAMDGFPNFLMIFGPNTATGHSSVILASENMVNYALKFVKLIIDGDATTFDVKREAEEAYTKDIQESLKKTVWHNGGCQSWYFDQKTGWNSTLYPHSQFHFTWRCMFPVWSDWNIKYTRKGIFKRGITQILRVLALLAVITGAYRYRLGKLKLQGLSLQRLRDVVREAVRRSRAIAGI